MAISATLITDHLVTWISATKRKSSAGRGSGKKYEFYGNLKVRELILELAVRGCLVPQDPADEPASLYLKRVATKKSKLIKEGKIGRQKSLSPVTDEDIQFPLPHGWQWIKLGNLVEMYNGRAFKTSEWADDGIPIVRIQNLNDPSATFNYFNGELSETNRISDGTFLISWSGTPGTSFGAFIWRRGEAALNQHINKCVFHDEETNLEFMRLVVNGQMNYFISKAQGGVGLKHVTKGTLNNAVLGIPPLAEQHRIVAKVEELTGLCDQLMQQQEKNVLTHGNLVKTLLGALTEESDRGQFMNAWKQIASHFDILFNTESSISQLKQTILQLAVRGELVDQDPKDEPASLYLKRVATKKSKLIKEGKIGRQKPLSPVTDEDIQFPLPHGWQWIKLGNLVEMYNGRAFKTSEWADDGIPIVRIQNLNDPSATFNYFNGELSEANRISDGTFLISWSGTPGTSFGAFIWRRGEAALNQHINKCVFHDEETNLEFMRLVVNGQMNHFISKAQGGVGLKHVTKGTLNNAVLGIPPLAEQHRIVAKVEELTALCDRLKASLHNAQISQLHLADSFVDSAIRLATLPAHNTEHYVCA